MKKLGLSLVVTSLVANLAFAEGAFVGAKGGIMHEFISTSGGNSELSNTHPSIGINGGYDFGKYRVYGEFNYNVEVEARKEKDTSGTYTDSISSTELIGGVDYYLSKVDKIQLFAGGFAGFESRERVVKFEPSALAKQYGVSSETKTHSSDPVIMLGARFGGIYAINDNSDVEFGARLDKPFYESGSVIKLGAFVGYTYKF